MRIKHTFRLPPELGSKLADYAARKNVPQALVVETALASYLSPDGADRLEAALAQFAHGDQVEVVWRSFELDPHAPRQREGDLADRLARKYGMTRDQALAANARLTDVGAVPKIVCQRTVRSPSGNPTDCGKANCAPDVPPAGDSFEKLKPTSPGKSASGGFVLL